jgi:RNA polymerase sigma factor (sigma-70 family)
MSVMGVAVADVVQPARSTAEEVWGAYYAPLAGWVAGMTGDRELGREIAAEAFTRLLSRWRRVEDPKGFLYVVATNLVRDHWRREGRRRNATARLRNERDADVPAPDRSVRDVVDRLPEKFRTIVLLHYYADVPVLEVARAVGRPEGTVKRELSEARALLHAALEETR